MLQNTIKNNRTLHESVFFLELFGSSVDRPICSALLSVGSNDRE